VTVSRYRESDRAALLEFRRDHYGADAAQADPAYVDWQFRDAPGAAESGAPLHVAWKDGRIVGTIGTVRTSVWVNGQPEPCSWVIDFAVHRDLRRSGIGDALAAVSRAEPRTRLVLEVTPAARGIAARAGHQVLGEVPLLVRPLQPARWLRSRGFPGPLAWISHAASPALAGLDALALRLARSERVELVETPSFDARGRDLRGAVEAVPGALPARPAVARMAIRAIPAARPVPDVLGGEKRCGGWLRGAPGGHASWDPLGCAGRPPLRSRDRARDAGSLRRAVSRGRRGSCDLPAAGSNRGWRISPPGVLPPQQRLAVS